MDSHLIQRYRYKLQNRFRRVKAADVNVFHWSLCQFWEFLNSKEIFRDILAILEKEYNRVTNENENFKLEVEGVIDNTLNSGKIIGYELELHGVIAGYRVVKSCVQLGLLDGQHIRELNIGRRYTRFTKGADNNDAVNSFIDNFVEPLFEYIDEQLDDQNMLLSLLIKYKNITEWFEREKLRNLWKNDTSKGEEKLALDLYKFLYSQGLEFHVEPKSSVGRIDLISEQSGDERLLVDAKVFNRNKCHIIGGFNQIYTYALNYNQAYGCLVVYNVTEQPLAFDFKSPDDRNYSHLFFNNKSIFAIIIDIGDLPPASQRGKLKACVISEAEIVENEE